MWERQWCLWTFHSYPPSFPRLLTMSSGPWTVGISSNPSVPDYSTEQPESNSPTISSCAGDWLHRPHSPNGVSARWRKLCQLGPPLTCEGHTVWVTSNLSCIKLLGWWSRFVTAAELSLSWHTSLGTKLCLPDQSLPRIFHAPNNFIPRPEHTELFHDTLTLHVLFIP